jgi:hypothetical protein
MPATTGTTLRLDHQRVEAALDHLREIADALDHSDLERAAKLIMEANKIVERQIVEHERAPFYLPTSFVAIHREPFRRLRAAGVSRIVMVTGDRADAAETIGARNGR